MKKSDLKELMVRALTDEISESEREILEANVIPDYGFNPGFSERVMNRIAEGGMLSISRSAIFAGMDTAFVRIALAGVAAIVILAISIFVSQGSLSYDTLLGLDSSVDEGLISLLIK